MSKHPIPAEGLAGRVYSEPRGGSVSVVTGIRVGGHPVLVLPCDENGETTLHELLREGSGKLPDLVKYLSQGGAEDDEEWARWLVKYIARIDAEIGGK